MDDQQRSGATTRTDLDVTMPGDGSGFDPDRPETDPSPDEARRAFGADTAGVGQVEMESRSGGDGDQAEMGTPPPRDGGGAEVGTPADELGIETSADIQSNSGGNGSST